MGYQVKALRFYRETTPGTKPASPTNFSISPEGYSVVETQSSETLSLIGDSGEITGKTHGDSDFAGDMPLVFSGQFMPIILHHVIGAGTATDATTDVWATEAPYIVGEIVNHTNGLNTLVCTTAGTSAVTEPTITTEVEFDKITDGTVEWVLRPVLKEYTGQRDQCLDSFGIEMEMDDSCAGSASTYERTEGAYISSIEFGKDGGTISTKSSMPIIAGGIDNSITNDDYEAQSGTDIAINKIFLGASNLTIKIDGVAITKTSSAKITINRNITIERGASDDRITNFGVPTAEGTMDVLFTLENFARGYEHSAHELQFIYDSNTGDVTTITFPIIRFDKNPAVVETSKSAMINGTFAAEGNSAVNSIQYTCVSG
ncbi:MAG: hypothetical protein JRJ85_21875, partial [Deltaproteobacteria bacterium]|nr:hypothetical protein [Deltaproteobacteria bacterium]